MAGESKSKAPLLTSWQLQHLSSLQGQYSEQEKPENEIQRRAEKAQKDSANLSDHAVKAASIRRCLSASGMRNSIFCGAARNTTPSATKRMLVVRKNQIIVLDSQSK